MIKKMFLGLGLFIIGAVGYAGIELLWRGRTHWTMMLAGGLCLNILYVVFRKHRNMDYVTRAVTGTMIITPIEFVIGIIVNYRLHMNIWDYSNERWNILGQICPLYSMLWGILTLPVSYLCIRLDNVVGEKKWK